MPHWLKLTLLGHFDRPDPDDHVFVRADAITSIQPIELVPKGTGTGSLVLTAGVTDQGDGAYRVAEPPALIIGLTDTDARIVTMPERIT